MALIIKEAPKHFTIPDEGLYKSLCVDVVDLGFIETPWGKKNKLSIIFELDAEDQNGQRYIIGKRYTKSLNEKSNLRQDLERWRNKKFKQRALNQGFDLELLIGVSAIVYISHNETEKRTYANIESILPPEQGKDGNPEWHATRPSGNYTRVKDREGYKEPEEYAKSLNGADAG